MQRFVADQMAARCVVEEQVQRGNLLLKELYARSVVRIGEAQAQRKITVRTVRPHAAPKKGRSSQNKEQEAVLLSCYFVEHSRLR